MHEPSNGAEVLTFALVIWATYIHVLSCMWRPSRQPPAEVELLAAEYQRLDAIPAGHWEDATHVAICTVNQMDVLVSWNFKHLANVNRERRIAAVNESLGYVYPLRITTPLEVMNIE